jgi:hypothetical protein
MVAVVLVRLNLQFPTQRVKHVATHGDYVSLELWLLTGPISSPNMISEYGAVVE